MKPKHRNQIIIAAVASLTLAASSAQGAVLIAGTAIGVDFGPTAPTNSFNQVSTTTNGTIIAGGVINTSNVTVDNVAFSWSANNPYFNNNDSISIAGQPAVFNESNLTDWLGISSDGGPTGVMTLTFTGLNNSLTYNLSIGSGFGSNITDVLWSASSQSATTDSDVGSVSYVSFTGLTTNGSGSLVITGTGTSPRPDIVVVSALHLTAVPEPSAALLGGLSLLALLRRRR